MAAVFWLCIIVSLFFAYWAGDKLRGLDRSTWRPGALVLLALVPFLALLIWLWGDPAFGLGMAMLFPAYAPWAIAAVAGYFWGEHAKAN